ncbi:hypothetical protein TcCL_ESM04668, partial [Trypanosoma cruzi]
VTHFIQYFRNGDGIANTAQRDVATLKTDLRNVKHHLRKPRTLIQHVSNVLITMKYTAARKFSHSTSQCHNRIQACMNLVALDALATPAMKKQLAKAWNCRAMLGPGGVDEIAGNQKLPGGRVNDHHTKRAIRVVRVTLFGFN